MDGESTFSITRKTHGGGEILDYFNDKIQFSANTVNIIKVVIMIAFVAMIAIIAMIIVRLIAGKRRVNGNSKQIVKENRLLVKRQRREKFESKCRILLKKYTDKINKTIFVLSESKKKRYDYVVDRLNVKVFGEKISTENFNLLLKVAEVSVAILLVPFYIFDFKVIICIQVASVLLIDMLSWRIAIAIVESKDKEIKDKFFDLFVSVYYNLISENPEPIDRNIRAYMASLERGAMYELCEDIVNTVGTYGETSAAIKLQDKYKEIGYVAKLFRLVKQKSDGGSIEEEMASFKNELFNNLTALKRDRGEKNMAKAKLSFYLLYAMLGQAILSALSIYLEDLSMVSTFLG